MSDREQTPDEDVDATVVAEDPTPEDEVVTGTEPEPAPATSRATSRRSGRVLIGAIVAAVLMLAGSAGLAGWLYYNEYRPDKETDPAAAQVALEAAKTGTIALLSYSPESLDQDFANAKSKLTGDFLDYYTQFTEQIVTPAAKEKSVKTAASVVRAGVSQIAADSAEVLVFINQTTTSKENPDGAFAASSVKVGMKKIDGNWLIASFDPV
ncbi:hypothetical protein [Mycolicibacterium gilvum]|uniref:Twin-arginine translocation pathway signal n=1 Tax=Mycolicibacterium gilvum TaxID=1804 RepID=A0A378SS03_9MYCO|nr:hypothetical protein [Mycolicibacterium gilvum]MCV7056989.1 hypothetical protein [Mycolicibacterium gilvum]STZ44686.1 twin-arginine translocation pathway signal [Mycolicibacterium gilvum]